MSTRVIGLGNTILTDDGVGVYAAREVRRRLDGTPAAERVDVVETEAAGLSLLDLVAGWDRIVLIDCIQFDGVEPGTVVAIDPADLRTSLRLRSVHEVDLPAVLELGERLGFAMPREVRIYGIQAADALTLGETLTPPVGSGMRRAVDLVLEEVGWREVAGGEPRC